MPVKDRETRLSYLREWRRKKGLIKGPKPKQTAEEKRAYQKRYRDADPDRQIRYQRKKNQKLKVAAMLAHGGKCTDCGETHLEFLTLDHINDDGNSHRAELGCTGSDFYRLASKTPMPDRLIVRCFNCNVKRMIVRARTSGSKVAKCAIRLREFVLALYGPTCGCCGEHDTDKLAIDHVEGGGNKDREVSSRYSRLLRIKRLYEASGVPPEGYRVRCHNCNFSIHQGKGTCAHCR